MRTPRVRSIEPATVAFGADGQPFSPRYGDVYASRDGAPGQARHVFLAGNDPGRWTE
jgi:tRNA 5-methylaminomethyl-2-thiouridine biosynthesis bifunctional protein